MNVLRDARYGVRMLRRNPGFTAVAVLALALGIAANTAIFSVVYATLLAPLPYPEPDQLVMVWSRIQNNRNVSAAGTFLEWKRQATVFQDLNAFSGRSANLATADHPEQVQAGTVTPGFFTMIGYGLAAGRDFRSEEGVIGRDHVTVLTNSFWHERFGGDPQHRRAPDSHQRRAPHRRRHPRGRAARRNQAAVSAAGIQA